LLTNSALVYEPKCGRMGGGGGSGGLRVSANEYSCALGAQIKFGDLTPYLTYRPASYDTVKSGMAADETVLNKKYRESGVYLNFAKLCGGFW
jgi:hypothetical protein